ncbi:MAG: riboflavin biosynthesis protein RibF [Erysipelotrichaceae bacterium]|jgi:riboflavin kinase/FMN adenylyltransferase|nr:riboflavin biosynthesis protein RibF [Erysipelotrichaceae bacterium]
MEIIRLDLANIKPVKKLTLCLGYFDGIHTGHQAVIKTALDNSLNGPVGVLTFSMAPGAVLKKYQREKVLTSIEDRARILEEIGVSYLFVLEFNEQISKLSADDFLLRIINKIRPQLIVCGEDYHFGVRGSGNWKTLKKYFNVMVTPIYPSSENKVSSTRIFNMIENGEVDLVKEYLGYRYTITGRVDKGDGIGSKELVPTANITLLHNYLLPKNGVYFVKIRIKNYPALYGLANIGVIPTLKNLPEPRLEIYIDDFNDNIYGQMVMIEFRVFIREEMKFASVTELKKQIDKDIKLIEALKLEDNRLTSF